MCSEKLSCDQVLVAAMPMVALLVVLDGTRREFVLPRPWIHHDLESWKCFHE